MIPKKPAPDLIRGVQRFSEKIMTTETEDHPRESWAAVDCSPRIRQGVGSAQPQPSRTYLVSFPLGVSLTGCGVFTT
jgi:hypothetical protein